MKILYLHQYFATRNSSTATRSYEIAKQLVSSGHDVWVITTDAFLQGDTPIRETKHERYYEVDGIHIIAQRNNYSNHMGNMRRTISFFSFMHQAYTIGKKLENVDVMFATSTPLTIAIPTLMLQKKLAIPFVFEVRDLWPEAPYQMGVIRSRTIFKLLKYLEVHTYKKATEIIALSPGMEEGILGDGIPAEKITMIPNMCDFELFSDKNLSPVIQQELIERYQLNGQFILSHIGAMGEANGLDYLMEAARILDERKRSDIKIIIGGDGKVKPRLESYVQEHQLQNVLFTGMIKRKEVADLTELAAITMTSFKPLPILATNSPNKFFDSLAAGKPIIVNSDGWTKNLVEENGLGYYVNPEKPEELADLLEKLADQPDQLISKAEIQAFAKTRYAVTLLTKQVENILVKVGNKK